MSRVVFAGETVARGMYECFVCVPTMHVQGPWKPEEGVGSLDDSLGNTNLLLQPDDLTNVRGTHMQVG